MDRNYRQAIFLFFGVALLFYLAWVLREALLLIWVAVMIAVLFTPLINWICRLRIRNWHPSRGTGLVILLFVVAIAATLFFWLAFPPILRDLHNASHDLPMRVSQFVNWLHLHLPFTQNINTQDALHYVELAIGGASAMFSSVTHGVVAFITVLLMAAYFILDGPQSFAWFVSLFPDEQQPRLRTALINGGRRMRRWLAGQMLLMLAQGLSGLVAFGLIHVHYFYVLAVLAGLFNIIPVLGPVLTVIVAGLVAAIDSYTKLLGVVIFYVVYHNIENAFLNPRIMEARIHIPAVAIVVALVIGEAFAGIVGILIAVPTAALLAVLIDEYMVRRPMVKLAPGEAQQAA